MLLCFYGRILYKLDDHLEEFTVGGYRLKPPGIVCSSCACEVVAKKC